MPLTNEAIIPIGSKDKWNAMTPYSEGMEDFYCNPELALYVNGGAFGSAVPAFSALKLQAASQTVLGPVNFQNGQDGLYVLYGHPATTGTALDTNLFGNYLLRAGKPRSADLLPIFHTGVPNLPPYQLATGKTDGNPLTNGKPFINNFLPTFGDMLRLNMAVPVTPRNDPKFSSLGLIQAAVLGLTDSMYADTTLEFIPNMDGFPNGRRLEDDVTRIELQAVGGVVLAAVGLWYDDRPLGASPLSNDLLGVLGYTTGVEMNDTTFKTSFPYVQTPWRGYGKCGGPIDMTTGVSGYGINVGAPALTMLQNYPNPFKDQTTFKYRLAENTHVNISVFDINGRKVATLINQQAQSGTYEIKWNADNVSSGIYIASLSSNGRILQTMKVSVAK